MKVVIALGLLLAAAVRSAVAGEAVLIAPNDAPRYRLSNLRIEDDRFGRAGVVFDYVRTRDGEGRVELAGRSADGELGFTFAPKLNRPKGEVRIGKTFGLSDRGYNYEFYFVVPAYWAGERYGECLVSNAVRIGDPGPGVSARRWTAKEQAAYDKQQLADTPPEGLPVNHEPVRASTPLLPGMPIQAGRFGDWVEAEVLALVPVNKVTIRFADRETAETLDREDWLAVDPETLRRAASDPDSFRPSMRVLPGGRYALPRDAVAIDAEVELPRGAPLLRSVGGDWKEVNVSEDLGVTIKVVYPEHPAPVAWNHKRSELAIRRETLAALDDAEAVRRFAEALDSDDALPEREITVGSDDAWGGGGESNHVFDRDFPIEARIPKRAQRVPDDLELPEGTPVAYCWAWKWQAATMVADRGRKLILKADKNVSGFAWRVPRNQVIIQDKTLRKLRRSRGASHAELAKVLRTWTDSTGEHKVEARLLSVGEETVKLRTDSGREIELPLERLSDEDQQLLKSAEAGSSNPFE